ncbi:hypothetical protein GGF46_005512 [Coemansia sp. RSA 552]|nr:hypothetical protein GGF46_005512 [Coemansia sp. RSA 552]
MTGPVVRIVVAGGNYAGLNAMQHLYATLLAGDSRPQVRISLVDRRSGFMHYVGITRGLAEPDTYGHKLWVPYSTVDWLHHPQIALVQDTVEEIHPHHLVLGSQRLEFDYLIVALGISRFGPVGVQAASHKEFVEDLRRTHREIASAQTVAVVGGGAVGVEMAADIKCDFPSKQVTLFHSRALPIPGPFDDDFRRQTVGILHDEIGVAMELGQRVTHQHPQSPDMQVEALPALPESVHSTATNATLTLADGRTQTFDWVIRCLGTHDKKHIVHLPSSTDTPIFHTNGIRVRETMQVDDPLYPHIYACGDVCDFDQIKLAGMAMYGAHIAARNIARTITHHKEAKLEPCMRYPSKMLLLLGKGRFIMQLGDEIWDRDRTAQYVHDDMGLVGCIESLSLDKAPSATLLD